jgi:hypothetical protein
VLYLETDHLNTPRTARNQAKVRMGYVGVALNRWKAILLPAFLMIVSILKNARRVSVRQTCHQPRLTAGLNPKLTTIRVK